MIICHKVEHEDYNELIFEYKEKGENMLNIECKQCHEKWHHDNAKYCTMCGKKLVEEPEFKVGDYVVEVGGDIIDEVISHIESEEDGKLYGSFFIPKDNDFFEHPYTNDSRIDTYAARHATPEEIAEYEVALNFHKHGRKPFEVKNGDFIRVPSGKSHLVYNPENYTKEEFLDYGWEFLKTVEEVNEWLGASDETK